MLLKKLLKGKGEKARLEEEKKRAEAEERERERAKATSSPRRGGNRISKGLGTSLGGGFDMGYLDSMTEKYMLVEESKVQSALLDWGKRMHPQNLKLDGRNYKRTRW